MSNTIETKSVMQLIVREKKIQQYAIPYYQRGYRWEKRHVEYLLNDIDTFMDSRECHGTDYCLQPVVVTSGRNDEWEVIDGQQRLITLYLIFKCIGKPKYQLHFLQRTKSNDFIQKLDENNYNHDEPDFHYMSEAYETIKDYFDTKMSDSPLYADKFYVAMENVKVVWYELDLSHIAENEREERKIDIFNRLNIGKIALTDAELIRALLLSKIKNGLQEREVILRQAEISDEWNRIEHELKNDEFWYFLNEKPHDASRIEFIFDLMAGGEAKDYTTYLWFEKEIKRMEEDREEKENPADKLWGEVKKKFGQLKSWYNNRTLYHYIGFLLIVDKNKYSIQNLMEKLSEATTKSSFKSWLKERIKDEVKDIDLRAVSYGSKDVKKILLLFNVLTLEELPDIPQNRFSFRHYKNIDGDWSIEHIHAQNSEDLKDPQHIKTWLEKTKGVLINIKSVVKKSDAAEEENDAEEKTIEISIKDYVDKMDKLLSQDGDINVQEFNELKQDLYKIFDSGSVHELSNLALLGKHNNSSLKNYIFPVKRDIILDLEKRGNFIPLCTKMVFLKAYSNADYQPFYWSEKDKDAYFSEIERIINTVIK